MSVEMGVILANCVLTLAAIVKILVQQNSSKKESDSFETRIKLLEVKVNRFEKLDEKFDLMNTSLTEVKTQLGILLSMNGIKLSSK